MTDMLIDGIISKKLYDEKRNDDKKRLLEERISHQKDIGRRMVELRVTLEQEKILDDGTPALHKLTFVLRGNQQGVIPDAIMEKGRKGVIRWRRSWQRLLMKLMNYRE